MAGALDHKRFIDRRTNPEFASRMDEWIRRGRIPPFAIVFPETEDACLADEDKPGKDILQLGFLITDRDGRVLPQTRAPFGRGSKAGHTITTGDAVLVSWSPVALLNGRTIPQSEADVREALYREVRERPDEEPPALRFLGLARRSKTFEDGGEIGYDFYLFEAQYSGPGPLGEPLVKDKNDRFLASFQPVDDTLVAAVADKKVDLRALEALTGRDFSASGHGGCALVRPSPDEPPPFLVAPPGAFLCHSSRDKEFVLSLADRLERAGIPAWVDHHRLRPGDVWFHRAFEAIAYCQAFLVVCSAESANSGPVEVEVRQALQRQRWLRDRKAPTRYEIIPVLLDGERPESHVPEALRDFHGVDLRDPSRRDAGVETLVRRLSEWIGPSSPRA